jgi:hypothetical protein
MNKKLKLILIVFLSIGVFFLWFVWQLINEQPPEFFPLDNHLARYTIIKSSTLFQGWDKGAMRSYSQVPDLDSRYYVEYRGEGVFNDEKKNNFFRITVGNSKVDLSTFIDKDVRIIKGKFVSSSKQCIVNNCVDIYGPYIVLDIDSIQEAK